MHCRTPRNRLYLQWLCLILVTSVNYLHAQTQSPPLAGIAHVALRVSNLERSRAFYEKLGYEQAFAAEKDGNPTEAFLKINDRQFLELYPARPDQPLGFLHVCFQSTDLAALYDFYIAQGLKPAPVRKAGAGNLLFTMEGPEHQNIEFTQYMPGSRHTLDTGKHLGTDRLSPQISAVALKFRDLPAATDFYDHRLRFPKLSSANPRFSVPGDAQEQVVLESAPQQNQAHLFLKMDGEEQTKKTLRDRKMPFTETRNSITLSDPDGNLVTFVLDKHHARS